MRIKPKSLLPAITFSEKQSNKVRQSNGRRSTERLRGVTNKRDRSGKKGTLHVIGPFVIGCLRDYWGGGKGGQ